MLRRQRIGSTDPAPRHRRAVARWLRVATAALALVGAAVTNAQPAHAEPSPVRDSFESNPLTRWRINANIGSSVVFGKDPRVQTGVNLAWFETPQAASAASIYREVTVDFPGGPDPFCYPSVYLRKVEVSMVPAIVDLNIREGGINGPIIAATPGIRVMKALEWEYHQFTSFPWRSTPFIVEIRASNRPVLAEDFFVKCVPPPH